MSKLYQKIEIFILEENDEQKKSIDIKLNKSSSYSQKNRKLDMNFKILKRVWRIRTYDMLVNILNCYLNRSHLLLNGDFTLEEK